jgi:flavin reductase (DIM6/NTAB) family NADH-FMN oxidoreductase RutF
MAANLERDPIAPRRTTWPQHEPAAHGRALRDALGCLPTGVAVITGLAADGRPLGLPRLEGAVACFDCLLQDSHDAGDHRILIGGVERFANTGGEPLLFVQGGFRAL